jgi:hypothetical protein
MRKKVTRQGLGCQAIAGTHVVLLGFNMDEADCEGLLGFAIHRTDHVEEEAYWLKGLKTFAKTDPGLPPGAQYSTRQHPIQSFTWSDLSAKPGYEYTYRILALKGSPRDLQPAAEVKVRVRTESPDGGTHDVYFNRGAAGSQEYARRFGDRSPNDVGPAAFHWLSRGLVEGITDFIARAAGPDDELRVCAYEFHYPGVLAALSAAVQRGATVRVIYDGRKDPPSLRNQAAAHQARLESFCVERTANRGAIAHNKFIVWLRGGQAAAVLTGGTNFSESGIYGHSNVVHVVEEPEVAAAYARYWEFLLADPQYAQLRPQLNGMYTLPDGKPPSGTGAIFSPRQSTDALEWYAALAAQATDGLFMTFAFGMHPRFQDVYRTSAAGMRFALMEKVTRPMAAGPARKAEEAKIRALRDLPQNRFAVGAHFTMNRFDRWLGERLSGLSKNVRYVHTKYMLIDPLSDDPIVVGGSANFSDASSTDNDENMLIIRGNRRVADIYLGEFMRLYRHYAFREWAAGQPADARQSLKHLQTGPWWREYFGDTERSHQRQYFAD